MSNRFSELFADGHSRRDIVLAFESLHVLEFFANCKFSAL